MMLLRAVIGIQIASIALIGAMCRDLVTVPDPARFERPLMLLIVSGLFGFPVLVLLASVRARLREEQASVVIMVEASLIFTYFLALLPSAQ